VTLAIEADAYARLEALRWSDGVVCPHCGHARAYFLTPRSERGRATRRGKVSARRVWKCADCRQQFSVLTATAMHGSKIPVHIWLAVVADMCGSPDGVSAREVERTYGLERMA
jgi:transposase-like protein